VSAQGGVMDTDRARSAPPVVAAEPRVAGPPRLTLRVTLLALVLGLLLVTIALLAGINYVSQTHSITSVRRIPLPTWKDATSRWRRSRWRTSCGRRWSRRHPR